MNEIEKLNITTNYLSGLDFYKEKLLKDFFLKYPENIYEFHFKYSKISIKLFWSFSTYILHKLNNVRHIHSDVSARNLFEKVIKKTTFFPMNFFIIIDTSGAIIRIFDENKTIKENRDAYATIFLSTGELFSTGYFQYLNIFEKYKENTIFKLNLLTILGFFIVSSSYKGFSLNYELKEYDFSALERYSIFSREFWFLSMHPKIKKFINHKNFNNELSKKNFIFLKKYKNLLFIANSIGHHSNDGLMFSEYIIHTYGQNKMEKIRLLQLCLKNKNEDEEYLKFCEKQFKSYFDEYVNKILTPTKIYITKQTYNFSKKISRLSPDLPNTETKLICEPNFNSEEPVSTGKWVTDEWECSNSFIQTILRKNLTTDPIGLFNLCLANSGIIDLGRKKVHFKSFFHLCINSTMTIYGSKKNSPDNFFIFPKEGFSGYLIGDPNFNILSHTKSIIDLSALEKNYTVSISEKLLTIYTSQFHTIQSKTHFLYINAVLGHKGTDIIDCHLTNILFVDFLGGLNEYYDQILNCQHVILYPYTIIRNNIPLDAYLKLTENAHHIIINNIPNQNTYFSLVKGLGITLLSGITGFFTWRYRHRLNIDRRPPANAVVSPLILPLLSIPNVESKMIQPKLTYKEKEHFHDTTLNISNCINSNLIMLDFIIRKITKVKLQSIEKYISIQNNHKRNLSFYLFNLKQAKKNIKHKWGKLNQNEKLCFNSK